MSVGTRMTVQRKQVELLEKNRPRQARAKKTYEAILAAAADLLVEVGIERISTNLIAERAGITVPALYRYFPNKYAVINALGAALMDRQNQLFNHWFERYSSPSDPGQLLEHIYELLSATYELTRKQSGGTQILQSLRAVEPLQDLRLNSHALVAGAFEDYLASLYDRPVDEEIVLQARLSVDTGYNLVEMALEDSGLDAHDTLRQGAFMLQQYWRGILAEKGVVG